VSSLTTQERPQQHIQMIALRSDADAEHDKSSTVQVLQGAKQNSASEAQVM
jgi:hypothetical protein